MNTRLRTHAAALLTLGILLAMANPAPAAEDPVNTSSLWGNAGEKWTPQSRLPDFSFAGYHNGEKPIPDVAAVSDVTKFGVKGDGVTDDAPAIQAAIDATENGAVVFPAGRFVLGDTLWIKKSHLVLRGAGVGKTVFLVPRSLATLHPRELREGKMPYAFSGGFVTVRGFEKGVRLAAITQPAARGATTLTLDQPLTLAPGTLIRVLMNNDEALGKQILGGEKPGEDTPKEKKNYMDFAARVVSTAGKTLTIDHPLRLDVDPQWQAEVWSSAPTTEEVGIEGVTFEFPGTPKKKHLLEEGFNAIYLVGAVNSWVRDVETIDCDNAINVAGASRFCTIARVTTRAAKRAAPTGHHAFWATGGAQDCLFTDFNIETQFVHDLTVEGFAAGNVFMNGKGQAINFDHHRNAPYENLFTNLEVGNGKRLWESSGSTPRGPHSGVRETFWNIRATTDTTPNKPPPFAKSNLIAVPGYGKSGPNSLDQFIEPMNAITPENLYEAQLKHRLEK
jgi:hypothetical protein